MGACDMWRCIGFHYYSGRSLAAGGACGNLEVQKDQNKRQC